MKVVIEDECWERDSLAVYLDDGTEVGRYCIAESPEQERAELERMLQAVVKEQTVKIQEVLDEVAIDYMAPSSRYDALAERFYKETHLMAPGKSVPLEMCGSQPDQEVLETRWREWLAERQRKVLRQLVLLRLEKP